MSGAEPLLRSVSDTALWTALFRARESERPDALFHDPYARRLAGERGEQIAAAVPFAAKHAWSFTARTYLVDQLLTAAIHQGADLVVNLAAGLDTRPYRLALPPALPWIEVDLPGILDYKESVLRGVAPVCALERVRLDLGDAAARAELLQRLGQRARRGVVVAEGLLIYLEAEAVAGLARELARAQGFERWIFDLASPGLVRLMQRQMGREVAAAGAPFRFGPAEGPAFFAPLGWKLGAVHSPLQTAAQVHRLPWTLRLFALLPATHPGANLRRPWSGVCNLERAAPLSS
ncbi:MAG TPA: SAM-dependent methyltransferase [Terriglobales bacterium]|nr:SAM-dependent methyltransferase [Terriglobales bacterium]